MIDCRPVAYVIGRLLILLALLMVAPTVVEWHSGDPNVNAFAISVVVTGFLGAILALSTANAVGRGLDIRQAYLLTVAIWLVLPVFGALPFWLGAPYLSPTLAYFEAVSGLTTTGATVIRGLDVLPAGMNLWRGMMNWVGGLGIAFIAMIFLPLMRAGGMQFFRTEGFDTFGKALPRAADIARELFYIYLTLTVLCVVIFSIIGMPPLAAVVHGISAISTGGFSPYDGSYTGWGRASEYFGVIFMILGSLPFVRYVQLVNGQARPLWYDAQIRAYLSWLLLATLLVSGWRLWTAGGNIEVVFRESLFNLTSIMSSSGTFAGDFPNWGGVSMVVALILGVIGACSGSTASGLSVFRVQVALAVLARQVRQIAVPSAVDPVKYQGRRVEDDVIHSIIMFITCFLLIFGVLSVAMTLVGVDLQSALFAIWATLCNVGYGLGPLVAKGGGTFSSYPTAGIVIMTLAMILGRLGLVAVLILLLPGFWRR